ncbi:hypothetical protein H9623_00975 [Oerskovia sp. Sa1BUA8]|uniref:Tetratricopeptide repeat protein n=1 Tax=Oerskovia douganii TaxID=2762210 RepID=A0A9D5U623_9CELL|nr:hypothetical protein [Oerskovia douganii]MBE7698878.1 hypothetical protein [Oerskovia douganii]
MRNRKGLIGAVVVTALLALYVWAIVGRAAALMGTGEPAGIAIGIGVLLIPLLVIGLIAWEFWLAFTVQRMADELAAAGELPVDDLPRSPGGRIDRAAADAAFEEHRARAEEHPDDWRSWYHVAFAYDASGDRKRARAMLRKAAGMYRTERKASR